MTDVKTLQNERQQVFHNLFRGRVPRRVPISNPLALDACIEYAGENIAEVYWDTTKAEKVLDKVCNDFFSDGVPGGGRRYPTYYQILGSKPFIMSSSGHMQHPNVKGMETEDYDEFINSPYDCIMDKVLPRLYTELDADPNTKAIALTTATRAFYDDMATIGMIGGKLRAKYGFPTIAGAATTGPYDFMADFFRSFTGISSDIRRMPDKVVAACEAITPLLVKKGNPVVPSNFAMTMIPLHMAPYMRTKDFEKFYWPTLKKQVEDLTGMGINVQLFVEHDFTRYLDHLNELPENTILRFEYGDPKVIKEKVGKKHIVGGLYPLTLLHTGTKEQCIDKAKELLDVLAPGGGYWFSTDKGALDMHGNITENLQAVLEYVHENGKYDNPDEDADDALVNRPNRRKEIIKEIDDNLAKNTKYFNNWEKYREAHPELEGRPGHVIGPRLQKYENMMFNFIINLCS